MESTEKNFTAKNLLTGMRVILRYLAKYRRETIILSIFGVISAMGNGTIPYIAGKFFDSIINLGESVTLYGFIIPLFAALLTLWFIVQIITYFIDWKSSIRSESFSNKVWVEYMADGFSYLWELPMSFHKKNKIGTVGDKINRAGNSLETILGRIVIDLSPQLLSIIIAFGIGFYINPILAGVLLLGVLTYIVILIRKITPLASIQKQFHDKIGDIWGHMYDAVGNALTLKQSVTEKYENEKLHTSFRTHVLDKWNQMNKIWSDLNFYQRMTILCTQIAVFIISVAFISKGTMSLGDLLAFNAYSTMIFGPFVTIGRNWQTIQNGIIDLSEAEKYLNTPTEIYEPKDALPDSPIEGNINFNDVSFSYNEGQEVLKNISFSVKAGEKIALVGESGVGKSTLIDLISGYHFATDGTVEIDGHNIQRLRLRHLRSQIAVVPQEVVLFNDTIINNIKYGNFEAPQDNVEAAAKKAHALDFINKFPDKWEQMVGERGVKLSVGQKQRVAIARAILRNPKILILDEPTSALDAGSENIITKSLEELMEGKTTFIIAHRLSTVRKANKILVFKEGKIIESGTHSELIAKEGGEYKRLHDLQIGLHD